MLTILRNKGFDVMALHHAEAILTNDMPGALGELEDVLKDITLPAEELVRGGGGQGQLTQRIRNALNTKGWNKHNFQIARTVDGRQMESVSHEVDHVKAFGGYTFALEIEWNNKDPFFDRDLENYKRLHADGAISVGGIITRGKSLQTSMLRIIEEFARRNAITAIPQLGRFGVSPTGRQRELITSAEAAQGSFQKGWARAFVSDKFGQATTHWTKLETRVQRGVGNPCPLLLIGIPDSVVTF